MHMQRRGVQCRGVGPRARTHGEVAFMLPPGFTPPVLWTTIVVSMLYAASRVDAIDCDISSNNIDGVAKGSDVDTSRCVVLLVVVLRCR